MPLDPEKELALMAVLDATKVQSDAVVRALQSAPPLTTTGRVADDLTDAKIALSEARVDTKFAELRTDLTSQFGALETQLASKPGTGTLIGTAVAIIAIILAALAFGSDRLAMGIGLADQRQEQLNRDQEQDAATKATDQKLDELLRRIPAKQ